MMCSLLKYVNLDSLQDEMRDLWLKIVRIWSDNVKVGANLFELRAKFSYITRILLIQIKVFRYIVY